MSQHNISFAGAGRVAGALCKEIYKARFNIDLIVSLAAVNGRTLADSCESAWSADLVYPESTDIIIVAVPDQALKDVLDQIICHSDTLVVHTAGSMGLDIFPEKFTRKGIFYPLQTFSKDRKVDFDGLPFLLETSDIQSYEILENLVHVLGSEPFSIDTEHRRMLHLAAVFVCNFTNHMLTQGKEIASYTGFSFDLLSPLLKETILKAMDLGPEKSQTGPAIRNDKNTIKKHLELLSFSPELKDTYHEVTSSIIKYYNKSG